MQPLNNWNVLNFLKIHPCDYFQMSTTCMSVVHYRVLGGDVGWPTKQEGLRVVHNVGTSLCIALTNHFQMISYYFIPHHGLYTFEISFNVGIFNLIQSLLTHFVYKNGN